MSRNSTIELLNETDVLGYRMRWQLFVQENEAVVYGDYTGWQPGEPLFDRPRIHMFFFRDLRGNWIRPLFEILEDGFKNYGPSLGWCQDCHVGFLLFSFRCWVCHHRSEGPVTLEEAVRIREGLDVTYAEIERDVQCIREHDEGTDYQIEADIMRVLKEPPVALLDAVDMPELIIHARRIHQLFNDFGESAVRAAEAFTSSFGAAMSQAYATYSEEQAAIARQAQIYFYYTAFAVETFGVEPYYYEAWARTNARVFTQNSASSRPNPFQELQTRWGGPRLRYAIDDE